MDSVETRRRARVADDFSNLSMIPDHNDAGKPSPGFSLAKRPAFSYYETSGHLTERGISMIWQRARRPAQKEERRKAIMEAPADLFLGLDFDSVSLNGIARKAGLSKSNIYRYFGSKEEIFLSLYMEDVTAWVSELEHALKPLPARSGPEAAARAIAATMAGRPRLAALIALLSSVLERNTSEDLLITFKRQVMAIGGRMAQAMRRALPDLGERQTTKFALYMHAFVAGLWPAATPNPVMTRVLERPEFEPMQVCFHDSLEHALRLFLAGLLEESKEA